MYKLFLNGILIEDQPDELKDFDYQLTRDGGIVSQEHIFRKFSEGEFTFFGDGYNIINSTDICDLIDLEIYFGSDVIYTGAINPIACKRFPHEKLIKAPIYDNGFSSMIRERGNNSIQLSTSSTINGFALDAVETARITIPTSLTPFIYLRQGYGVKDTFDFIVRYLTDNKITVQSTYLDELNYYIIKGGSLGLGASFDYRFLDKSRIPEISFNTLFNEVRKKARIYAWIEGDVMYIENERDSYVNVPSLVIDNIPVGLEESVNTDYFYSEIKVGSRDFKPDDFFYQKYPYKGLDTWIEETYNNCECSLDNSLDLVSEWIIDSNIILETLQGEFESRFDEIFLLKCETSNLGVFIESDAFTNTTQLSDLYYNRSLQNYEVLKNWFGGLPSCISDKLTTEPCFNLVQNNEIIIQSSNSAGISRFAEQLLFQNVQCDSLAFSNIGIENDIAIEMNILPGADSATFIKTISGNAGAFIAKYDGVFSFNVKLDARNINSYTGTTGGLLGRYNWWVVLLKFDDIVDFTTTAIATSYLGVDYIDMEALIPTFDTDITVNFNVDALNVALLAGEIVCPIFVMEIRDAGGGYPLNDTVEITNASFTTTASLLTRTFELADDEEMKYKVIYTDILDKANQTAIDNNQLGYIELKGNKYWIKKLTGSIGKIGNFELIGKNKLS